MESSNHSELPKTRAERRAWHRRDNTLAKMQRRVSGNGKDCSLVTTLAVRAPWQAGAPIPPGARRWRARLGGMILEGIERSKPRPFDDPVRLGKDVPGRAAFTKARIIARESGRPIPGVLVRG